MCRRSHVHRARVYNAKQADKFLIALKESSPEHEADLAQVTVDPEIFHMLKKIFHNTIFDEIISKMEDFGWDVEVFDDFNIADA